MDTRIETTRIDGGYVVTKLAVVAEVAITRRDDLRGVWQCDGTFYATRELAQEAAERALEGAPDPWATAEPGGPENGSGGGTMIGG